jgi:hypothetical protein
MLRPASALDREENDGPGGGKRDRWLLDEDELPRRAESVKGRALARAPQAVSSLDRSCAPRPGGSCRDEGRPGNSTRLRRVERRALLKKGLAK